MTKKCLRKPGWMRIGWLCCLLGACLMGQAQALTRPLLIPGKQTLYQRVITREPIQFRTDPTQANTKPGDPIPLFSIFYVYAKDTDKGETWLEVGTTDHGEIKGWIPEAATIPWRQALILVFANPEGRDKALLFRSREDLEDLLFAEDKKKRIARLTSRLGSGQAGPDSPIISIEPDYYPDFTKHFYLLPILYAEETYTLSGEPLRVVELASVSRRGAEEQCSTSGCGKDSPPRETKKQDAALLHKAKTGVVFVIDSTISMGPYIENTRKAVERSIEMLDRGELHGKVAYGVIAFRDNTDLRPGLGYVTRTIAPLGSTAAHASAALGKLKPATTSSAGVSEDAYAGVLAAIEGCDWAPYAARHIVLITDASARAGSDPYSATHLGAEQLRILATEKRVAIHVFHVQTPHGRKDHARAHAQYDSLSNFGGHTTLYYPVDARQGSVAFKPHVNQFVDRVIGIAKIVAAGRLPEVPGKDGDQEPKGPNAPWSPSSPEDKKMVIATRAMLLPYLGRERGAKAPLVFRAWASDRDLTDPAIPALDVRILVNKRQLSNLAQALDSIVEAANQSLDEPERFFDRIRSLAARMSRDPNTVTRKKFHTLGASGLLDEFVADLPYRSKVLNMDEDLWMSWTIVQQQDFIDELENKLHLYQHINDHSDQWVSLSADGDAGDAVYPLPIDALP